MARRQTVIYDLGGTTDSSGECTLRLNRLRPGQLLCVQCVAIRHDDTKEIEALIGIDRAALTYEVHTIETSTRGVTYSWKGPIWVESDCQLTVAFTGCGASQPVYAWVYGYLQDDG